MSQPPRGFFDRNTLLAIGVTFAFMVGWQQYMAKKYPKIDAPIASQVVVPPIQDSASGTLPQAANSGASAPVVQISEEKSFLIDSDKIVYEISSAGLGIKSASLKDYTDRKNAPITLINSQHFLPFSTYSLTTGKPIMFAVEKINDFTLKGTGIDGLNEVTKIMTFEPNKYAVHVETSIKSTQPSILGFKTFLADSLNEYPSAFLVPSYEHQEFFWSTSDKNKHEIVNSGEDGAFPYEKVNLTALSTPYFTQVLINNSDILPSVESHVWALKKQIHSEIKYQTPDSRNDLTIKFTGYTGPKAIDVLKQVDERASGVIDLGFFSALAKPLLSLMKLLQSYLGNWGLAIICLTLIVRLVVLPFNISSYKSMKRMQELQGPMKSIRERYKDDSQKMNIEIMALMKKEKVNPIGGCLPMLLQLPIFFALYQVFAKSIELYKAPFAFWIHDLSFKDPYYVLPVMNALIMFLQQKMTPSTMDESQRKIMMFMPLVFSVFMLSLPSGLTLYWFISTLFGFIQQVVFMRDRSASAQPIKA